MLSLLVARLIAKGGDMGDILDLSIKEFNGKLVHAKGSATSGTSVSLTASSGHDLYLATAKVNVGTISSSITQFMTVDVDLFVNNVFVERYSFKCSTGGAGTGSSVGNYEFTVKGVKVLATQIIRMDVTVVNLSGRVNCTLVGFEEDTGNTPQIKTI